MKTVFVLAKNTTVITVISDLGFSCASLLDTKKNFPFPLREFLFTSGNLVISKMSLLFSMACLCEKCLDKAG